MSSCLKKCVLAFVVLCLWTPDSFGGNPFNRKLCLEKLIRKRQTLIRTLARSGMNSEAARDVATLQAGRWLCRTQSCLLRQDEDFFEDLQIELNVRYYGWIDDFAEFPQKLQSKYARKYTREWLERRFSSLEDDLFSKDDKRLRLYFKKASLLTDRRLDLLRQILSVENEISRFMWRFFEGYTDLVYRRNKRIAEIFNVEPHQEVDAAAKWARFQMTPEGREEEEPTPPNEFLFRELPETPQGRRQNFFLDYDEGEQVIIDATSAVDSKTLPPPVREFVAAHLEFLEQFGLAPSEFLESLASLLKEWVYLSKIP